MEWCLFSVEVLVRVIGLFSYSVLSNRIGEGEGALVGIFDPEVLKYWLCHFQVLA